MTAIEKRLHRANRDLRYLHKNATKESEETQPQQFCYDHLTGYCARDSCKRWHQMREPRIFGVCKFYITGTCNKGNSCEFMHSDFPCRFYYLNISHPPNSDGQNCRFQHGGPLPKRMIGFFLKHIEHWTRKLTQSIPHEHEKCFEDYKRRFDERQENLAIEYAPKMHPLHATEIIKDKIECSFEKVFNQRQIELLLGDGYKSLSQVNSLPIDILIENYKLTMDQIYEISINSAEVQDSNNSHTADLDLGEESYFHSLYKENHVNEEARECVNNDLLKQNGVRDLCKDGDDLNFQKEDANHDFFIESLDQSLCKESEGHTASKVEDKRDVSVESLGHDLAMQSRSDELNNEGSSHNLHEESLDGLSMKPVDNNLARLLTDSEPDFKAESINLNEPQINLSISDIFTENSDKCLGNESMAIDQAPPNANNEVLNSEIESDLCLSDSSDSGSDDNLVINEGE